MLYKQILPGTELNFHKMKDFELPRTLFDHNRALAQTTETVQQMFKFKDGSCTIDVNLIYLLDKKTKG